MSWRIATVRRHAGIEAHDSYQSATNCGPAWRISTVLVIDDNEAVRTAFDVLLSMHGVRVLTRLRAGAGARRAGARTRGPRDPGHELPPRGDLRRGRHGAVPRDPRAVSGHPDHPAHRLDLPRDRGRAGEGRRLGLRRQALGRRAAAHHGAQPARPAPRADGNARDPPRSAARRAPSSPSAIDLLRHRVRERCHAYARLDGHARGARGRADPDHRAERRGQGSDRGHRAGELVGARQALPEGEPRRAAERR